MKTLTTLFTFVLLVASVAFGAEAPTIYKGNKITRLTPDSITVSTGRNESHTTEYKNLAAKGKAICDAKQLILERDYFQQAYAQPTILKSFLLDITHSMWSDNRVAFKRWKDSPTFSCFKASPIRKKQVTKIIENINKVIGPRKIILFPDNDKTAACKIYFASIAKAHVICQASHVAYTGYNLGPSISYSWTDAQKNIIKGLIVLPVANSSDDWFYSQLRNNILFNLGFAGSQKIHYSRFQNQDTRPQTHLALVDQWAIAFAYRYLTPGMTPTQITNAFNQHFRESVIPLLKTAKK